MMSQESISVDSSSKIEKKTILLWILTILIPALILILPENDVYTHQIKLFFAITLAMILMVAFETLPILIPSLLLPVIYGLAGLAPMQAVFGPWSSSMPWLFIAIAIEKLDVSNFRVPGASPCGARKVTSVAGARPYEASDNFCMATEAENKKVGR